MRVIYFFIIIYYENHTHRTAIKKTLNAHWARRKATLYFIFIFIHHSGSK